MARRRLSGYVTIQEDIPIDDILCEIDDDELMEELRRRKGIEDLSDAHDELELARQALIRGDASEALVWVERALRPDRGLLMAKEYERAKKHLDPNTGRPLLEWDWPANPET